MTSLDLFSDKSDLYALARPQYPRELFEFLASCIKDKNKVWDCACGNGQASVGLAEFFCEVQATDMSAQQIAHAMPKENIFYSVQSAEHTNFTNNYFDAITVAQAIHWFDYDKYWPEALRVLNPGGIFAAWGYNWFTISPEIDAALKTYLFDIIEPYWAQQNRLAWNGYVDIQFPFEKISSPKIIMKPLWNLSQLLTYLHTWSATRRCMQDKGTTFFELAAKEVAAAWGNPTDSKEIDKKFYLYIGRKK